MVESSFTRGAMWLGAVQAGTALLVAFYGGNGAGMLGVVFALALVLPGLVYLRGGCAVYCAMAEDPADECELTRHNQAWPSASS